MQWPDDCYSPVLDTALEIVMDYLHRSGQAQDYPYIEQKAATKLIRSWRAGARHPIRLANDAIVALEAKQSAGGLKSVFPRVV
jgi:hypothetical protein